ncbi:MAG: ankyrin repeat domain-containing protein [Alphaproteobacteria bacterium]
MNNTPSASPAFNTATTNAQTEASRLGQALLEQLGQGRAPQADLAKLKDLLARGASVQEKNTHGLTALMLAIRYGHTEMAGKILDAGASVHAKDNQDNTPLLWCAYWGDSEIALRLLRAGARIDDCNSTGRNVLTQAAGRGNDDFLKAVIGWGLDADHFDRRGDTALCAAAAAGRKETALALIDAGANPVKPARNGKTPAQTARDKNYSTVADAIEKTIEDCRERIILDDLRPITEGLREDMTVGRTVQIRKRSLPPL